MPHLGDAAVPMWVCIACSVWVAILIPAYIRHFGWANFLWFSDLSLFMTVAALWLNSQWLFSMAIISVVLLEVIWNVDYFTRLISGRRTIGLTDYMFNPRYPKPVRALSLFHIWLLVLWVWLLPRIGYESRAWMAQSVVCWIVLIVTYTLTPREQNVNWVFGLGPKPQKRFPPLLYLGMLMIALPTLVYFPTHLLLQWWTTR